MVFGYPHETGIEESPCESVGYIGLNAPVVEERERDRERKVEGHIGSNRTIDLSAVCLR